MKNIVCFMLFSCSSLNAQEGYFNKLIHTNYPYGGSITQVETTEDNFHYIIYDLVDVSKDSTFINVIKLNAKADTIWANRYGSPCSTCKYTPRAIQITAQKELIIVGYEDKPDTIYKRKRYGFILKLDSEGHQKWLKKYTDGSYIFRIENLIICNDGDYLVFGNRRTYDEKYNEANYADPYIMKIDSFGNIIWKKVVDDYFWQSEIIQGAIETKNKEYLLVGYRYNGNYGFDNFILKLDDKGQQLLYDFWGDETYNDALTGIIPMEDNNYLISGLNADKNPSSINQFRSILTKINDKGDRLWTKSHEAATEHFTYNKLLKLPTGDFVGVGGQDKKPYLCGATKFDKDGNVKWHRSYTYNSKDKLSQHIWGGDTTNDKGFILCGSAFDSLATSYGSQGWLLKLDSLGCLQSGCAKSTATEDIESELFFTIFPNPSTDFLRIELSNQNLINSTLEIIDGYGRIVYKYQILPNITTTEIDVSHFVSGVYMIRLQNAKAQSIKKILIVH